MMFFKDVFIELFDTSDYIDRRFFKDIQHFFKKTLLALEQCLSDKSSPKIPVPKQAEIPHFRKQIPF